MSSYKKSKKTSSKSSDKYLTGDDYQHIPEAERMMKLEMYTGSKKQKPREEWLYNFETNFIEKKVIMIPECVERCFLEPLTNASDNVGRSRRFGIDPGKINVMMTPTTITIENSGVPIPVEYKQENEMYVPELIFGVPGSSSHYSEETRHEAGVNGLGVKLTNVFSKFFELSIYDPIRKKSYYQQWNGTMLDGREEPIIRPYKEKESLVRVKFKLDFGHFHYKDEMAPEELYSLFARHCADISFTSKIPVLFSYVTEEFKDTDEFTELEFVIPGPRDYAYLYFGDGVDNSIVHYEWPKGTKPKYHQDGRQSTKDLKVVPLVEMCVIDTPDNSENISFVNSMMTRDGGVHVETALKSVSDHIVKFINGNETSDGLNITLKHVRPNISLVLSVRVQNPGFSGQTKNKLVDPNPFSPKIHVPEKVIKNVEEWEMIKHLKAIVEAKKSALLSKSDGKKRNNVYTKNGQDANEAGNKKSDKCTLYIVEGLSASSYPKKLIDLMENGRDYCGILPVRGKFLNVMRARADKIAKNTEVRELKQMLGLEEGVDYTKEENLKKLRYGRVVIMADSDDDGKHIIALLLLYFHCRFPSLLQIGYVYNYMSPIIRVIKGKKKLKFYTFSEYNKWYHKTKDANKYKTIYFKGLGRTTDRQIKEDFGNQRVIKCLYDDYAPETIKLAFSKEKNHERKAWLAHFSNILDVNVIEEQPISEFLNTELIKYGLLGLKRAIPAITDGFKDSQRKAMWGMFRIWNNNKLGKIKIGNKNYQEMKVARIATSSAEETNYHHGEKSLEGTIVAMAQDFTGSNNLPYFDREGQFGTRDLGGKDAADARYAEAKPEWWVPYIFRREDLPILTMRTDEGKMVEPETFYPIIPNVLINGCNGIALGYSTFVPNHNPLDILSWIKSRMHDKPLPSLKPWYRGFQGTIEIIDRRAKKDIQKDKNLDDIPEPKNTPVIVKPSKKKKISSNDNNKRSSSSSEDENKVSVEDGDDFLVQDENAKYFQEIEEYARNYQEEKGRPLYSLVSKGEFYTNRNGKIIVTELPIGRWTHPYYMWLMKLREEKKLRNIRNVSKSNVPGFEISGFQDIASYKSLNLQSQIGMSNMVLLDLEGRPRRFDTVEEYLETFYEHRLEIYGRRKSHMLEEWTKMLDTLSLKRKFIQVILDEDLIIHQRDKKDIYEDMDRLELPHELLTKTSINKLTQNEINKLDQEIKEIESDIETLTNTEPKILWEAELSEFELAYRKHYKIPCRGQKLSMKVKFHNNTHEQDEDDEEDL